MFSKSNAVEYAKNHINLLSHFEDVSRINMGLQIYWPHFFGQHCTLSNIIWHTLGKVIAKTKRCPFYDSQCLYSSNRTVTETFILRPILTAVCASQSGSGQSCFPVSTCRSKQVLFQFMSK